MLKFSLFPSFVLPSLLLSCACSQAYHCDWACSIPSLDFAVPPPAAPGCAIPQRQGLQCLAYLKESGHALKTKMCINMQMNDIYIYEHMYLIMNHHDTHARTVAHTHTHTHTHMHMNCARAHTHTWTHARTHKHTHTDTHKPTDTHKRTHTLTARTHTDVQTHEHASYSHSCFKISDATAHTPTHGDPMQWDTSRHAVRILRTKIYGYASAWTDTHTPHQSRDMLKTSFDSRNN